MACGSKSFKMLNTIWIDLYLALLKDEGLPRTYKACAKHRNTLLQKGTLGGILKHRRPFKAQRGSLRTLLLALPNLE